MAQLNYSDYESNQQKYSNQQKNYNEGPQLQFMSNVLVNDGDVAIVRFPYANLEDIKLETCHEVSLPGSKYPQKVRCTREHANDPVDTCPLCKDGIALINRFFVKALVYKTEGNKVVAYPVVWDRSPAYAKELRSKMSDYGDLTQHLFKIKRNGVGQETTYSTDIVLNAAVYKPEVYKADFSIIERLNPAKILARDVSKYTGSTATTPTTEGTPVARNTGYTTQAPVTSTTPNADPNMYTAENTNLFEDPTSPTQSRSNGGYSADPTYDRPRRYTPNNN